MALEENAVNYIKSIISKEPKTGWDSTHVAGKLSEDLVHLIAGSFKDFDKQTKLDILLSLLHLKSRDLIAIRENFEEICNIASKDDDKFVNIIADVLKTYPDTQQLNVNIEYWNEPDSVLNRVKSFITENGLHFHSPEYMLLDPKVRPVPAVASPIFTSWQPTVAKHFELTSNTEDLIHPINPGDQLIALVSMEERTEQVESSVVAAQKRPGLDISNIGKRMAVTSPTANIPNPINTFASPPTTPTSGNFPRPIRPPPRGPPSGGSSLFITKPRQRPPTGKPIQRSPSGSRTSATLPRGFQRQQRVQMLDFKAATEFEQTAAHEVSRAEQRLKAQKEEVKMEKKRMAEEKKAEGKKSRKNSLSTPTTEKTQEQAEQTQEQEQQADQDQQRQQLDQQIQQHLDALSSSSQSPPQPSPQPSPAQSPTHQQPPRLPVKKAYTGKKTDF
ncbi:hypothetical protein RMCBS344292_10414 [Rhizopus microsporus]|nr:hypothetical protein RMCBS344292_10414 [Rhizopus microsporus]